VKGEPLLATVPLSQEASALPVRLMVQWTVALASVLSGVLFKQVMQSEVEPELLPQVALVMAEKKGVMPLGSPQVPDVRQSCLIRFPLLLGQLSMLELYGFKLGVLLRR
jgi:hypothetical protein